MGNEFQDVSTAPTLTLDPFQTQEKKQPPAEQPKEEPALDESILTMKSAGRWMHLRSRST